MSSTTLNPKRLSAIFAALPRPLAIHVAALIVGNRVIIYQPVSVGSKQLGYQGWGGQKASLRVLFRKQPSTRARTSGFVLVQLNGKSLHQSVRGNRRHIGIVRRCRWRH